MYRASYINKRFRVPKRIDCVQFKPGVNLQIANRQGQIPKFILLLSHFWLSMY